MSDQNMIIHLVAGGIAGTTGAVLTCPLEVIKTRFQSSYFNYTNLNTCNAACSTHFNTASTLQAANQATTATAHHTVSANFCTTTCPSINNNLTTVNTLILKNHNISRNRYFPKLGVGILLQFKRIVQNEGYRGLFKGLVPSLFGVAPYRAVYFFSYANSKVLLLQLFHDENPVLHVFSAIAAGFSAVTLTNPIWFVKTRMQLDHSKSGVTALNITKKILKEKGILGFYKGISASYFGISETAIYFVFYEQLKRITAHRNDDCSTFLTYVTSSGFSKSLASCICYPHEVARTRLRQEGDKYKRFFQTLNLILKEEGFRGLYKGLATHLIRQIPNTIIVMTTYEFIVNYFIHLK